MDLHFDRPHGDNAPVCFQSSSNVFEVGQRCSIMTNLHFTFFIFTVFASQSRLPTQTGRDQIPRMLTTRTEIVLLSMLVVG